MVTRFGKYKLGVIWMLIDPLVSVIILGIILGPLIGRTSGDVPYAFFLLCGFMILRSLTGPISMGIGAMNSNRGLLVFRQVQPIDPFIARFIFELFVTIIAFTTFCVIGAWMGIQLSTAHLWELLGTLVITWLIGCGLGLTLGVLCVKFKEIEKIAAYIQRPLIFISGVLYPISVIPHDYRQMLLYNPIVHTVETSRKALFPNYIADEVNLVYPSICALVSLTLGLMVYRNNRHFLTQR